MINFLTLFLLFISCSFIGWILECMLLLYEEKRFINRGFLTGPVCPLYGAGALAILFLFNKTDMNLVPLFFLIILTCGSLEYITSYLLEIMFKTRWWDYSKEKFNINGRLNLVTLFAFGIMGLIFMYIYLPFFNKAIKLLPSSILVIITLIILLIFIIDLTVSFIAAFEFKNASLKLAKDISEIDSTETIFKFKEKILKKNRSYKRLIKAFPTIRFNVLDDIKNKIKKTIPKD